MLNGVDGVMVDAATVKAGESPDVQAWIDRRRGESWPEHWDGRDKAAFDRALGVAVAPGAQEPIPDRVYWAPLSDNFYSAEGHGMGLDFYRKWKPRRAEFPQGESFGWGPGSQHNPFKDPPRAAGVSVARGETVVPTDADDSRS